MELTEAERRGFLRDEYLLLQNQYEDLDRRSLTIKGWIGSGSIAALALAFGNNNGHIIVIPVFTAIIASVFWLYEVYWKLFQYSFSYRIRVIEAYFREDPDRVDPTPPIPFQAYHCWFEGFEKDPAVFKYEIVEKRRNRSRGRRLLETAFEPYVCPLYIAIIVLSFASALLLHLKA